MAGKQPDLFEAVLVDELCNSLPRRQLAGLVLLFDALFAAAEFEFGTLRAKFGNLVRHRRCLWPFYLSCHSFPVSRLLEGFGAI